MFLNNWEDFLLKDFFIVIVKKNKITILLDPPPPHYTMSESLSHSNTVVACFMPGHETWTDIAKSDEFLAFGTVVIEFPSPLGVYDAVLCIVILKEAVLLYFQLNY